jgi:hypothetical protein
LNLGVKNSKALTQGYHCIFKLQKTREDEHAMEDRAKKTKEEET